MKHLVFAFFFGFIFLSYSQNKELKYNRPFVIFEECDNADDKEKCFNEKSAVYIFNILTDSLKRKLINKSKKDTITLSARLYFDEKGSILTRESYIHSSVDSTSKDLNYIISHFPKTKPVLDEFDQGVATHVGAFYGFKVDSLKTNLELIPNFEPTEVPFAFLGTFPVFDGCPKNTSNEELKKCMNQRLMRYIQKNFKSELILSVTGLPEGINSIFLFFKIDKKGKIKATNVRAPLSILEREGYRLIENMPEAKVPGMIDNKPVDVPYFLPIKFVVEATKKDKRRRKRKS